MEPSAAYKRLKWGAYVLTLAALLALVSFLPLKELSSGLTQWVESLGIWGPVALAVAYVFATVLFVPGTLLTLVAGAVFGLLTGFITVSIGSTIGASLAFLIARYFARDKVASLAANNRHFNAIDAAIEEGGWRVVGLLRLSPAVPFNLQNYLYGLTKVRFWPYVLTSWIAMMPGTFMYIYLGHVSGSALGGDRDKSAGEWVLLGVGLLATIAVTVYITKLARKKLNEDVDQDVGVSESENTEGDEMDAAKSDQPDNSNDEHAAAAFPMAPVVVATLMVILATAVGWKQDAIGQSLSNLFGPPKAELGETYEANPDGPTVNHLSFNNLLSKHVDGDGWIDYDGFQADVGKLNGYIKLLADTPFDKLGRNERLAALINAYNACTIRLIVDHRPLKSIKDIPSSDRWDAKRWELGGKIYSLNEIEHELIRPNFRDARIHFALVCAAVGCPPLRNEAYTADRLDEQLKQQARYVHDHKTWFQFTDGDNVTLKLTKLYQWYGGDFAQIAESEVEYAAQYSEKLQSYLDDANKPPKPDWLPYDWSLNSKENKQAR